ncbi:MAG: Ig-like domain-containing protein [Proteobacteria bacterium]|nr:Ig-like domain-containing protein [Pseudomonadota bacterium]
MNMCTGRWLAPVAALIVVLLGGCIGQSEVEGDIAVQASMLIVSGDGQTGEVGTELAQPLVVKVVRKNGRPLRNRTVNFVVTTESEYPILGIGGMGGTIVIGNGVVHDPLNGKVFAGVARTNRQGLASDFWTLGARAELQQTLEARAVDPKTGKQIFAKFTATAVPGSAYRLGFDPHFQFAGPFEPKATVQPVAIVRDKYDNPVSGVEVTFAVTAGDGSVAPGTVSSDADGRARVDWTLGPDAGLNQLSATAMVETGSPALIRVFAHVQPPGGQGVCPSGQDACLVPEDTCRASDGRCVRGGMVCNLLTPCPAGYGCWNNECVCDDRDICGIGCTSSQECPVPSRYGQPRFQCDTNAQNAHASVCRPVLHCLGDSDCPAGLVCGFGSRRPTNLWGECIAPGSVQPGDPCTDADECDSGRCHTGICLAACTTTADCNPGQNTGQSCEGIGVPGLLGGDLACVRADSCGGTCTGNKACVSGSCVATCEKSQDCGSLEEQCVGNVFQGLTCQNAEQRITCRGDEIQSDYPGHYCALRRSCWPEADYCPAGYACTSFSDLGFARSPQVGLCARVVCPAGRWNCDGYAGNGCESSTQCLP